MGSGRGEAPSGASANQWSLERLRDIGLSMKDDMTVLKSIWFNKPKGDDHAERLESFYKPQAREYDKFRANFLWGRRPMLAACAARLSERKDMIWVDLGGGTGENVDMMSEYISLDRFKAIYVVDLCASLCEVARKKAMEKGWKNVHVVHADACTFQPEQAVANLVTFSYSLTMIPPFHDAVDKAATYLAPDGMIGVADFFVSGKYDMPMRQMSWLRRFFWRSIFDTDNIDIGPERRQYLDHKFHRVWEYNGQGSIPYVPYLRAPFYVWIGQPRKGPKGEIRPEAKVEAPPLFPPTFLYNQSWEDPEADMKVFDVNKDDVCLTLTSGGCNSLNLVVHGAKHVVSVDCNPAQSALLEMKALAIRKLDYEDFWQLFGEGRHPNAEEIYERKLAPFMTEASLNFWNKRLWYFKQGLYFQGGMGMAWLQGKLCYVMQILCVVFGMTRTRLALANAATLEEQRKVWNGLSIIRFLKEGPKSLVAMVINILTFIFLNRAVLWFGGGVPCKQYELIERDGVPIWRYIARTFDGVAQNSHLRKHNYFYYACLTGKFLRDNCPSYLREEYFQMLKAGAVEKLSVVTGTFMGSLLERKYTKVILMDHVDWLDMKDAKELADTLGRQVLPGGKVIWRSASLCPPYEKLIRDAGFDVKCLQRADQGYMDRVNMYSSFYLAVKKPKKE